MTSARWRAGQHAKRIAQKGRLAYLTAIDVLRFSRHAPMSALDSSYDQLVSRIVYNVHALEKGLARTHDRRLGFGRTALEKLNYALLAYLEAGFDPESFAFVEGISVIRRYDELHQREGTPAALLPEVIDARLLELSRQSEYLSAGTKVVRRTDKQNGQLPYFRNLAYGRSSVREFSGEAIDLDLVREAIAIAGKSPSVCNRQGWHVYWTEDKDLAARVLRHQRGFGYQQMPEVLLTVTVSVTAFLSPVERNQGYIDGGLFAMSLMYALEAAGLAAVPLNACLYAKDQRAVRQLLELNPADLIIMFIAVGALPDETVVPVSDRKPTDSIIRPR